jgi:hypothetical protein
MTEPSRLLAGRRGLSRPEKDAILDGVLARVEHRPLKRGLVIGALTAAAAAATIVMLVLPRDEMTAKGGDLPAGFEVTCVPAPCTIGSKFVFDITSTGGATYFAAWAHMKRSPDESHRQVFWIWYFPTSRRIPDGGGVLDTGIVLGPEHTPGTYTVEGVFSSEPLEREQIRKGASVKREVVIQ